MSEGSPGVLSGMVATFCRILGSAVVGKHSAVLESGEGGVDGESIADGESYGALGLVTRGLPPETVEGEVIGVEGYAFRTPRGLVPATRRDLRLNRLFPNPRPGDIALVGYGANFLKLGRDGRASFCTTTDGTPNGKLISLQLKPDGFAIFGPFGKITYGDNGFHLLHHTGARLDLGGIGGLPAPLDELGTYVQMGAAIAKIQASTIVLGPDTGVADNAAKATPTLAALTAIQTALQAVALGFVGLTNGGGPVSGPNVAAIAPALTALGAALTTAASPLGIPSQSTSVT